MKLKEIVSIPVGIALSWEDGQEALIDFKTLRDACPCANCSGESDLFGNRTFGIPMLKSEKTYELKSYHWVGHYAIQFEWADRHDAGIYTLEILRRLSDEQQTNI